MTNDTPQIHNLQQGSEAWHAFRLEHFGASEAAAMLGISKIAKRSELLHAKHTGIAKEFSDWVQEHILDHGHEVEDAARPIAEEIIGEDLYPSTYSHGKLSASCDGITLSGDVAFEHKQYNLALAESVHNGMLPAEYQPQCQQVMMVTGAQKLLFMVSDGTCENFEYVWVEPDIKWREALLQGWTQFAIDLAAYVPPEIVEKPKAEPIKDLPAVIINASGGLSVCNLAEVTPVFDLFIASAKTELVTDEDFANGEETAKKSRSVAKTLKMKAKEVIEQIATVGDAVRTLELYAEKFDKLGLTLEKAVKDQKETIKGKILAEARQAFTLHIAALEIEIDPLRLAYAQPDFAGAMKNKRMLASLHDAVNTELANAKIAADAVARDYRGKLDSMRTFEAYKFLFNDLQQIISKPRADFDLLVNSRIEAHKKAEAEKVEAAKATEEARIAAAVEAERKAGEARAAAAIEVERMAAARLAAEVAQKQAEEDQRGKADVGVGMGIPARTQPDVASTLPTSEQKRAAVVESQDEIAAFLNYINVDDKKRQAIRPYLVEFIKWRISREHTKIS